jgi:hypothetical protein
MAKRTAWSAIRVCEAALGRGGARSTSCKHQTGTLTVPDRGYAYFGEYPPTFIDVSQAHILDDAQGDRGWLENASPSAMAVEELPLGP